MSKQVNLPKEAMEKIAMLDVTLNFLEKCVTYYCQCDASKINDLAIVASATNVIKKGRDELRHNLTEILNQNL